MLLFLSPVPTCYAAFGDSCTTEIPKLAQNNPGITKIDQNTCGEGKKNDVMLLPSHIPGVGRILYDEGGRKVGNFL